MFKAQGLAKQEKLQAYADSLKCPFKISVVTGLSGSYEEHDLLSMHDKWLEPLEAPGRRWEIWMGGGLCSRQDEQCAGPVLEQRLRLINSRWRGFDGR